MKLLPHKHLNDEVLWLQLKQGSQTAFAQLFRKYHTSLYEYGLHLVNDREELLKDTIQELFTELWAKRKKLADVHYVKTYLFKSFRRNLLKELKKQRKFVFLFDYTNIQPNAFSLSIEDLMIAEEMSKETQLKVANALENLTASQREVIYLKFKDNLDYEEIEAVTNLKYQSIRNSVYRALKTLREVIRVN
ncbi:MAG: sigma-70 family RNA polymerase sigma factor [Chitinophagales bacterium]